LHVSISNSPQTHTRSCHDAPFLPLLQHVHVVHMHTCISQRNCLRLRYLFRATTCIPGGVTRGWYKFREDRSKALATARVRAIRESTQPCRVQFTHTLRSRSALHASHTHSSCAICPRACSLVVPSLRPKPVVVPCSCVDVHNLVVVFCRHSIYPAVARAIPMPRLRARSDVWEPVVRERSALCGQHGEHISPPTPHTQMLTITAAQRGSTAKRICVSFAWETK